MHDVDLKEFYQKFSTPHDSLYFFAKHFYAYAFIKDMCAQKYILEIGSGTGYGLYYLSQVARKGIGVDIDLANCVGAQDKYQLDDLVVMDGTNLGFKEASFDLAYCFQVIEHISEEKVVNFLKGIKRVLKDNGLFVCSTLNLEKNLKGRPDKYEMLNVHEKEYRHDDFRSLLSGVFNEVTLYGLFPTSRHRFYQRLKKWNFLKYKLCNRNPVRRFYDNISLSDFKTSQSNLSKAIDFIAVCRKS